MGAIAQTLPAAAGRFAWLWEFLKTELAPYRGRGALVARAVTASTLVMIVCMTFKIPYAAYGALFALNLSRESLERTADEARALVLGSALGAAYAIVSAMLVLGNAMLRFFWVGATLFLTFYVISALKSYSAAARFSYLVVIIIPVVNSQASAASKVENTLWAVGAIAVGSVTTLLIEAAFAAFRRLDDLTEGVTERLVCVEDLLAHYVDGRGVDAAARSSIERLAAVGTSRMRKLLQRASYAPQRRQEMGALVALVGRLVDVVANLTQFSSCVDEEDRNRMREIAHQIGEIRLALESRTVSRLTEPPEASAAPSGLPLLGEVEQTVSLLREAISGGQPSGPTALPPPEDHAPERPFVAGALSNPEHVRFALRGCLAASLCFIIYNALFWPGISTSVTTCLLTALSTVGASHQKQFLRFAGALVGGVVIGFGAQIFILPSLDSIGAFIVLFAVVSTIAAWIATSSARLSYLGVQIAVAFNLINLQEFKFQTSLVVARDRVVGILLGLAMMWIAFDLLWSLPAAVEMRKEFVSGIRLLAQLAREPVSRDKKAAIAQSYALREHINAEFDKVRSLADGVLFEFGPGRQQNLMLRERFRRWQPQLRTLFLMRIATLKYRLQLPGFELPESLQALQKSYDESSAAVLEEIAARVEGTAPHAVGGSDDALALLEQRIAAFRADESLRMPSERIHTFATLLRAIHTLTTSLAKDISSQAESTRLFAVD